MCDAYEGIKVIYRKRLSQSIQYSHQMGSDRATRSHCCKLQVSQTGNRLIPRTRTEITSASYENPDSYPSSLLLLPQRKFWKDYLRHLNPPHLGPLTSIIFHGLFTNGGVCIQMASARSSGILLDFGSQLLKVWNPLHHVSN